MRGSRALEPAELHRRLLECLPGTAVAVVDEDLRPLLVAGSGLSGIVEAGPVPGGEGLPDAFGADEGFQLESACRRAISGECTRLELAFGAPPRRHLLGCAPLGREPGDGSQALVALVTDDDRRDPEERSRLAADLDELVNAAGTVAGGAEPAATRTSTCAAAATVADASFAILYEPDEQAAELVATASVGIDPRVARLPPDASSGARIALRSARPTFVAELGDDPEVGEPFAEWTGARSALWQPLLRARAARAVLALGWQQPLAKLPDRVSALTAPLIVVAAVAIERARATARATEDALTDFVTDLPTRRAWEEELVKEIACARRSGGPLSVAALTLERSGADAERGEPSGGDPLLSRAAGLWRRRLRLSDTLARLEGDTFALAMPGSETSEAVLLASRLQSGCPDQTSCSIGVVEWNGREGGRELAARAEAALRDATRAGGRMIFIGRD